VNEILNTLQQYYDFIGEFNNRKYEMIPKSQEERYRKLGYHLQPYPKTHLKAFQGRNVYYFDENYPNQRISRLEKSGNKSPNESFKNYEKRIKYGLEIGENYQDIKHVKERDFNNIKILENKIKNLNDFINEINNINKNKSKNKKIDIAKHDKLKHALFAKVLDIGEQTKHFSDDFKLKNENVSWGDLSGLRNIIAHEFDNTDVNEILNVINYNQKHLLNLQMPEQYTEPKEQNEDEKPSTRKQLLNEINDLTTRLNECLAKTNNKYQ